MNPFIENSLCQDCKFLKSCSLTTSKNFIWSCSEYEIVTKETQNESQIQTQEFSETLKKPEVELV